MTSVRPSGPPRPHANTPVPGAISSTISPPSRTRMTRPPGALPPPAAGDAPPAERVGRPDRALGVERDAVGRDATRGDDLADVVRVRHIVERCPDATVRERAVAGHVERGQPAAERLGHD